MATAAARSVKVRPPGTSKPARQMGDAKPVWPFRPTREVVDYIQSKGGQKTDHILFALEVALHAEAALGREAWAEIVKQASLASEHPGTTLGKLAKSALGKKR